MARALERARAAASVGEVPVGAVIVQGGQLLAEAGNRTLTDADPTAHAEVLALRAAAGRVGQSRLVEATLYVTLEPCAMCAGAIVLARIPRVVFGAWDPKSGMAGSLDDLLQDTRLNHRAQVVGGVLGEPSGQLLRAFFQARRATP